MPKGGAERDWCSISILFNAESDKDMDKVSSIAC